MTTQITIGKMNRAQVKMMLDCLGVALDDQPGHQKDLRSLLQSFQKNNPDNYDAAYSLVVEHKSPDAGSAVQNVMPVKDASRLVVDEISALKDSALDTIDTTFKRQAKTLVEKVDTAFTEAVERESKKYNVVQHVVKIGKSKQVKLKGVVHEKFAKMVSLARMRKNILLVGPAGCGKTHVAAQIAETLGLDFASQSCSAGVSETAFTGKLLPLGKSGQFEYVESDFVRIYENGGVFLFDEIDASDANVLVFMNQALANEGFHNASRIGNTFVKKHPDFIAVAAANTFGTGADAMYTARNTLDAATLDRFRVGVIEMDYSEQIEEQLVDESVLRWGLNVREAINSHKLQKLCSTRFLRDATDMMRGAEWTLEEIAEMYFADWTPEELRVIGVASEECKVNRFAA